MTQSGHLTRVKQNLPQPVFLGLNDDKDQRTIEEYEMEIEMSPRKILVILVSIIGFLLFANLMGLVSRYVFDYDKVNGLIGLFDFDKEGNLPTLYSSLQLIVVSLLLWIVGAKHKSNDEVCIPWFALAVIFLFLAVDETAQIHERIGRLVQTEFEPTGLLSFACVIP